MTTFTRSTTWLAGPLGDAICLAGSPASTIAAGAADSVIVTRGYRRSTLKKLDHGVRAALIALASRRCTWTELVTLAEGHGRPADTGRLELEVKRLTSLGDIQLSCHGPRGERLTATASSPLADPCFAPVATDARLALSRLALCARGDEGFTLESPASHFWVTVQAPSLGGVLIRLGAVTPVSDLVRECRDVGESWLRLALAFLLGLGLLEAEPGADGTASPAGDVADLRSLPDALLHASSRRGLTDRPVGATFRFSDDIPPEPALKPVTWNAAAQLVRLPRPDLDRLRQSDASLTAVVEARRSVREYGEQAMTLDQLGEFLYRTARVKYLVPRDANDKTSYEVSSRPYPTGGAAYDIELYLAARSCDGLLPGFYYYEPSRHELHEVTRRKDIVNSFLREAYYSNGQLCVPQILFVLAARFARSSWKYEGIAYSLTLKNAGVLTGYMYLAATAMGLAPCALGSGDSSIFARATGLDPAVESSVGEFMLGTLPEGKAGVAREGEAE